MTATATAPALVLSLVEALPTTTRLDPIPVTEVDATVFASAVVASFVGSTSADFALVLTELPDLSALVGDSDAPVSTADALRPAIEAAAAAFGAGVLGTAQVADAQDWVGDSETEVFELRDGGASAGWFAVRVRPAPVARPDDASVASRLGRIRDVEMTLAVELGRTRMSVRDVLSIEPGAVIELDRSAGAPADVLLNGRLIAHGEIVVVDQDYAVRITRILDVAEGAL